MRDVARHIRGMPYRAINGLLPLNLRHDTVHLSEKALQPIRERHPNDCDLCIVSIDDVIAAPDYIGQEPHHPENFEMVKYISGVPVTGGGWLRT